MNSLQWRHNGRDSVSNHQPHDCLLNRLFRRSSNKTSKLRVTGRCAGISPGTGEFPAQMASCAENFSIWWCHHIVRCHRTCAFHYIHWWLMVNTSLEKNQIGCLLRRQIFSFKDRLTPFLFVVYYPTLLELLYKWLSTLAELDSW